MKPKKNPGREINKPTTDVNSEDLVRELVDEEVDRVTGGVIDSGGGCKACGVIERPRWKCGVM